MTLYIFVCKTYLLVKKAFVLKSEIHVYSFNFIFSVNINVQLGKKNKTISVKCYICMSLEFLFYWLFLMKQNEYIVLLFFWA